MNTQNPTLNETHNPTIQSWIESANHPSSDFPLQNLPLCLFSIGSHSKKNIGVVIGHKILNVRACVEDEHASATIEQPLKNTLFQESLNELMSLSPFHWKAFRQWCWETLRAGESDDASKIKIFEKFLVDASHVRFYIPAKIGDYTDFYASIYHATNVGAMFRPDSPLLPNYKYVPIGYHGRASSFVLSENDIKRPFGQIKPADVELPSFAPSASMDYEVELAAFIGGESDLGNSTPIDKSWDRVFGFTLLNDWSARDIQAWEYQPLGPFLAKNFATTISPFIVTAEALLPFRIPAFERASEDPQPLSYLLNEKEKMSGGLDIEISVSLTSEKMRNSNIDPYLLGTCSSKNLYWTFGQFVTHHSSNGCNLLPGDVIASGTISGPEQNALGCMLELTKRGKTPITLPTGETRVFLADGDEVIMKGTATKKGFRSLGFGTCVGRITPATY